MAGDLTIKKGSPLALLRSFDTQIYVDGETINNGTAFKYRQKQKI